MKNWLQNFRKVIIFTGIISLFVIASGANKEINENLLNTDQKPSPRLFILEHCPIKQDEKSDTPNKCLIQSEKVILKRSP
ncbi:MAG: hypothetical protein ACXVAX_02180 [Pseudobdellovibrio sp.]